MVFDAPPTVWESPGRLREASSRSRAAPRPNRARRPRRRCSSSATAATVPRPSQRVEPAFRVLQLPHVHERRLVLPVVSGAGGPSEGRLLATQAVVEDVAALLDRQRQRHVQLEAKRLLGLSDLLDGLDLREGLANDPTRILELQQVLDAPPALVVGNPSATEVDLGGSLVVPLDGAREPRGRRRQDDEHAGEASDPDPATFTHRPGPVHVALQRAGRERASDAGERRHHQ